MLRAVYYKLKAMTGGTIIFIAMLLAGFLCFYTVNGILSSSSSNSIRICVIDNDKSGLSQEYIQKLKETSGISVTEAGEEKGERLLSRGRTEALLYINEGFGEAMQSGGKLPLRFVSGSLGVSGEAAREILGGKALSMQSALDALNRLREEYSLEGEEIEGSFYNYLELTEEEAVPILEYEKQEGSDATEQPVFGRVYARYSGFAALVIFLFIMSLSVMLSTESSKSVNRVFGIIRGGDFLASLTDFSALFAAAFALCIAALLSKGSGDIGEWLSYLCYAVMVSDICMLLSFTRAGGGMDVLSPLFALVTGVLGGCFFDMASLGKVFEYISYFTPQGLLIGAVAGKSFCRPVMLAAGAACFAAAFRIAGSKK